MPIAVFVELKAGDLLYRVKALPTLSRSICGTRIVKKENRKTHTSYDLVRQLKWCFKVQNSPLSTLRAACCMLIISYNHRVNFVCKSQWMPELIMV